MHAIKFLLLAVLLLTAWAAAAQSSLFLEPRVGYGTFQMSSMKEFQQTIKNGNSLDVRVTDNFGPYFQYGLGVGRFVRSYRLGAFYEFGSTGGRVAYSDYSGEYRNDNILNYHATGVSFEHLAPLGTGKFHFVKGIEANSVVSVLKVKEYARVFDESVSSNDNFYAIGGGLKPYIGLHRQLFRFHTVLSVGYLFNLNTAFRVPGQWDAYLLRNSRGDKLNPNWSGLRLNLTFSIPVIAR